jgi:hypothetical protein
MFTAELLPCCTRDSQARIASIYKDYILSMEIEYSSETLVPL